MTIIMFCMALGARTPLLLWVLAMVCDTVLLSGLMALKALGKL